MNGPLLLFGDNAAAFNSREPECLLSGPAGSGKSLAWLAKILTIVDRFPGSRSLIVRKTRESLTESILVTWERDILGPSHPVLLKNPTLRRVRQSYRFPNRSEVVVGGMDKPDKVLSSEWDFIYVPEATDLDLVDWETLGGRLRAGVAPFQQLAADCNPTTPFHWLYKRQAAGQTRMYSSTHRDNPRYWDRSGNTLTEEGKKYIARLELMTGARRDRFLKGKWVAAEGLVYDYRSEPEYDTDGKLVHPGHDLPESWAPDIGHRWVWSIDWGQTAPSALQAWAVDGEGRSYLVREVYKTRTRPDELGKWARERWLETGTLPWPVATVCDHDEESRKLFEAASGLHLTPADKADRDKGIKQTQSRFDLADDGRPSIFFRRGCRDHEADRHLVDSGRPTGTLEELAGYVWDADRLDDTPIDYNDHGCDSLRYAQRYILSHMMPAPAADTNRPAANPHAATFKRLGFQDRPAYHAQQPRRR